MSQQKLLYGMELTRTDVYKLTINSGGNLMVKTNGEVTIVFVNGKFEQVSFLFTGRYTRNQWRILSAIEQMIGKLEAKYKGI
ncbi:MAG: hypothetical protein HOJ48_01215 [Desulfobacula sp.]|nr:hypothetical protein [Desulfobacula sp.]MBT6337894.1 hypothetical protein [Desulfobacula sp.]